MITAILFLVLLYHLWSVVRVLLRPDDSIYFDGVGIYQSADFDLSEPFTVYFLIKHYGPNGESVVMTKAEWDTLIEGFGGYTVETR